MEYFQSQSQQPLVTELSDLVTYMRAMGKFTSFVDCDCNVPRFKLKLIIAARQIHSEMYSMNETKAIELLKAQGKLNIFPSF